MWHVKSLWGWAQQFQHIVCAMIRIAEIGLIAIAALCYLLPTWNGVETTKCNGELMKILKWSMGLIVVVLIVFVTVLIFWGGHVVKHSVNLVGPQVLGVPVTLEHAHFYPLRGYVSLRGFVVGNPEGFRTESLFQVDHLEVDLDMSTLFADPLVINRILIDSPQITFEMGLRGTNLGTLLDALEDEEKKDEVADRDDKPEEPGRAVVIKEFVLADATVRVSATALRGQSVPITLGTVTLTDLGGEDQSVAQIVTQVVKALVGTVVNAVGGAGDLLGDGLRGAWNGVGSVGGFAVDGVRAVTGGVTDGARGLRDRITGRERDSEEGDRETPNDE